MDTFNNLGVPTNPWEATISADGKRLYVIYAGTNDMNLCRVIDDDNGDDNDDNDDDLEENDDDDDDSSNDDSGSTVTTKLCACVCARVFDFFFS